MMKWKEIADRVRDKYKTETIPSLKKKEISINGK